MIENIYFLFSTSEASLKPHVTPRGWSRLSELQVPSGADRPPAAPPAGRRQGGQHRPGGDRGGGGALSRGGVQHPALRHRALDTRLGPATQPTSLPGLSPTLASVCLQQKNDISILVFSETYHSALTGLIMGTKKNFAV